MPPCRCIEQGAECGHLPECPYYRPPGPAYCDDCGEPWCEACDMHAADCNCPGVHEEE